MGVRELDGMATQRCLGLNEIGRLGPRCPLQGEVDALELARSLLLQLVMPNDRIATIATRE